MLFSDVFVPKFELESNKITHYLFAFRKIEVHKLDAVLPGVGLGAFESFVLPNHYDRNFIEKNSACAHITRRKRRIDHALLIVPGFQATGIFNVILRTQCRRCKNAGSPASRPPALYALKQVLDGYTA